MKLKKSLTINGIEVVHLETFSGISVYASKKFNKLFFTDKSEVFQGMDIECKLSQGDAYVSNITFFELE